MKDYRLLVINPGSTSTKVGIFTNNVMEKQEVVRHPVEEIAKFNTIADQKDMRLSLLMKVLREHGVPLEALDAVVGRGGIIKPLVSGVYEINDEMIYDLTNNKGANHASALGGIIAYDMGKQLNIPTYVVNPVVVDELQSCARISGIPEVSRRSLFHALNQKAVAVRHAKALGKPYEECKFIVAHMGGGITVGAHYMGRVIDVNDGMSGDGPMSPERSGGVPIEPIIHMCFSGKYSEKEMVDKVSRGGGMGAYLGTTDFRECEQRSYEGDQMANNIREAMAYQVSKEIGAMAAVLAGDIDAILLTGGLSYSKWFTDYIISHVECFAPVTIYPGEDELLALAEGALRVLRGEEKAKIYHG